MFPGYEAMWKSWKIRSRFFSKLQVHLNLGPRYVLLAVAGRIHAMRIFVQWLARTRHSPGSRRPNRAVSAMADFDPGIGAKTLKKDGVLTGLRLKDSVHSELRDALFGQLCYGSADLRYPFFYSHKSDAERRYGQRFLQGHYYGIGTPGSAANHVVDDARLNHLLREYFRTQPRLVGMRAWWNFACDASHQDRINAAQEFHYDVDDYLALSVFFYLTDVDDSAGPHIVVRGSHGRKPLRHVLSLSRCRTHKEMLDIYGADRLQVICGQAGAGFIEDSFCFHKGQEPTARDRLVFQLRYALHDYGTGSDSAHREWMAADRRPVSSF